MRHTKLPFTSKINEGCGCCDDIVDADGQKVGLIYGCDFHENFEFILHACNMYHSLLEACEGILYEFPNGNDSPLGDLTLGVALMHMRDVVAKTKVENDL